MNGTKRENEIFCEDASLRDDGNEISNGDFSVNSPSIFSQFNALHEDSSRLLGSEINFAEFSDDSSETQDKLFELNNAIEQLGSNNAKNRDENARLLAERNQKTNGNRSNKGSILVFVWILILALLTSSVCYFYDQLDEKIEDEVSLNPVSLFGGKKYFLRVQPSLSPFYISFEMHTFAEVGVFDRSGSPFPTVSGLFEVTNVRRDNGDNDTSVAFCSVFFGGNCLQHFPIISDGRMRSTLSISAKQTDQESEFQLFSPVASASQQGNGIPAIVRSTQTGFYLRLQADGDLYPSESDPLNATIIVFEPSELYLDSFRTVIPNGIYHILWNNRYFDIDDDYPDYLLLRPEPLFRAPKRATFRLDHNSGDKEGTFTLFSLTQNRYLKFNGEWLGTFGKGRRIADFELYDFDSKNGAFTLRLVNNWKFLCSSNTYYYDWVRFTISESDALRLTFEPAKPISFLTGAGDDEL